MLRSRVIGTGSYVPARVLTNHDLEKMVETSDDWIATRTGIKERRIAVDEPTSDMASKAAKAALKAAGVQAKVSTSSKTRTRAMIILPVLLIPIVNSPA